jgi:hypothetical protein
MEKSDGVTRVVLALILVLAGCETPLRSFERTVDDWFRLVVELDQADEFFDRRDRKFVRTMINIMAKDEAGTPTQAQQKWLLSMKQRLDARSPHPR